MLVDLDFTYLFTKFFVYRLVCPYKRLSFMIIYPKDSRFFKKFENIF